MSLKDFIPIQDFEDYLINNKGTIISMKSGIPHILKPFKSSQGKYLTITLCKNGKRYKKDIHKLVALHFVENPFNKPVINHKDHNTFNNYYKNLEWVTIQENVHHSYSVMSPARNTRKCKLIFPDKKEMIFNSYNELLRYREKHNLDFAKFGLRQNGRSRGFIFEKL